MIQVSSVTTEKTSIGSALKKSLVLFDFDGTITTKDTLAEFIKFYRGNLRYHTGLFILSPILVAYVAKLMPNWKSKQYFLSWFLKNENILEFEAKCRDFLKTKLPALIRPGALQAIEDYKKRGATVAVVSASAENWVKPWCDQHGLICLATNLEVKDNKLTGKFKGKNCHGPEKVDRITNRFKISDFDEIIAYGDSSGDREMLALAHKGHYKPFRAQETN
jgi:phosphatidylglycerophosphatase C